MADSKIFDGVDFKVLDNESLEYLKENTDFEKFKSYLESNFEGRVGKCLYEDKNYWFIQIKTIWKDDDEIHFEVIYDGSNENEKYKEEGVRVEFHLEDSYNYRKLFCEGYLEGKVRSANDLKGDDRDSQTGQWLPWQNPNAKYGTKRYKIKGEIKYYKDVKEGFEELIKIFDPLLIRYEGKSAGALKDLLTENHNLILTGAPGTGKTHLAKEIASQMILGKEYDSKMTDEERRIFEGHYKFVQFHPSYDYTDFVEGLRPTKPDDNGNIGFKRQDGVFKSFCKAALKNLHEKVNDGKEADKFVFVIDEINRGDISKIFGELFFSIDPGYRGKDGKVQTQYQNMIDKDGDDEFKDGFYVPENVYIIGTMNDIDRSVESMDFAMRRRFAWYEVKAGIRTVVLKKLEKKIEKVAKTRMDCLNYAIQSTEGLGSAYHIGPTYFLNLGNYGGSDKDKFNALWKNHLKGLLYEYLRGSEDINDKMKKMENAYNLKLK